MNKNVIANYKKLFENKELEKNFYKKWHQVVYVHFEEEFIEK